LAKMRSDVAVGRTFTTPFQWSLRSAGASTTAARSLS
jgi:hypothetical protein